MAYVEPNFLTKKALREALQAGAPVRVYNPGLGTLPHNGRVSIQGPHYPEPHRWYATGIIKDGQLVKIS